jgi:hypothetical protein
MCEPKVVHPMNLIIDQLATSFQSQAARKLIQVIVTGWGVTKNLFD